MASDRQLLEEGSTDDYASELNKSLADELPARSALARDPGELMIIPLFERLVRRVLVPILKPVIPFPFEEELIRLLKQELLATMKESPRNEATTPVPKQLKLQFRNRISQPVFTGKRLVGENESTIEIALVDALTDQIINTGTESTAKLGIVGFRVGDDGGVDDSWTFEDFHKRFFNEKNEKRILQGDTCLQLKEGVCSVSKISFTHSSENTKNGLYRLGAGVVDPAFMNRVEVARTEAFLVKDGRNTYYEKHPQPRLLDKVCHLQHISYKGNRRRRLKAEGVITVKDLLTLLYTNEKRLQEILNLKASSNNWGDIVKNAQASSGMFLCLDPGNEGNTGVVLNAKLQLKGLIVEPHKYVPVDQLSAKQKVDNKELVKFASEHFETLHSFEDETSFKEYLISRTSSSSLPSPIQILGTPSMIDGPATPSSLMSSQHTTHTPILTSEYERGKAIVPVDNQQEDMPPHLLNFGHDPAEPGTSRAFGSPVNTFGHMNNFSVYDYCMDCLPDVNDLFGELFLDYGSIIHFDCPHNECQSQPVNSVSVCTIGRVPKRWTKVSKSFIGMILFKDGIRARKRQRCC